MTVCDFKGQGSREASCHVGRTSEQMDSRGHLPSVHVAKKWRPLANSQRQLANPEGYAGDRLYRRSGCNLTRVPSLAESSSSTVQIPDPQKPCEKCLLCQAAEFGVVPCTALDNEHRWSGSEHDPRDPGRLHFTGAGGPSPMWLQGVSLGTGVGTFFCH